MRILVSCLQERNVGGECVEWYIMTYESISISSFSSSPTNKVNWTAIKIVLHRRMMAGDEIESKCSLIIHRVEDESERYNYDEN